MEFILEVVMGPIKLTPHLWQQLGYPLLVLREASHTRQQLSKTFNSKIICYEFIQVQVCNS